MPLTNPSREQLEGMTVNERLVETGLIVSFDEAVARKDLPRVREMLESLHVDELSIARRLRDIAAAGGFD